MPDTPLVTELFGGAATAAGVDFGAWAQQAQTGAGAVKAFYRDGAGLLKQTGISGSPCYITQPLPYVGMLPDGTLEEIYEIRFTWQSDFDSNTTFRVLARFLPGSAYLTGAHQGGYFAEVKGGAIRVGVDNVGDVTDYQFFEPGGAVAGHEYVMQLRLKLHAAGSTNMVARYSDYTADPATWYTTGPSVNDSTVAYNDAAAQYSWGISAEGSAYVKDDWAIDEAQLLKATEDEPDTTPPTIVDAQVHPSGTSVSGTLSEACNPVVRPEGFYVDARHDTGGSWVRQDTGGGVFMLAPDGLSFYGTVARPVPAGWLARVGYDAAVGDVADRAAPSNAMESHTVDATNNSTQAAEDLGPPTPEYYVATRGNMRTGASSTSGKVAQTLVRVEMPYGAKRGRWRLPLLGLTDGSSGASHVVHSAAVWIQQGGMDDPTEPKVRVPLTFGGNPSAVVGPNRVVKTDWVQVPVLPRSIVWRTIKYECDDSAAMMGHLMWLMTQEDDGAGEEDNDGTWLGDYGDATDLTLSGGFDHTEFGPMNTGAYCCRGWGFGQCEGEAHQSNAAAVVSALIEGDSIDVFNDAYNRTSPPSRWDMRGWQGFAFQADVAYTTSAAFGSVFISDEGSEVFHEVHGDLTGSRLRKVTDVLVGYGANDYGNTDGDAIYAVQRLVPIAEAFRYGEHCWQRTLVPRNDAPATAAGFTAKRAAFNARVRTESDQAHTPGLHGWWEACDGQDAGFPADTNVSVGANMGSVHPTAEGHRAMGTTARSGGLIAAMLAAPNPVRVGGGSRSPLGGGVIG